MFIEESMKIKEIKNIFYDNAYISNPLSSKKIVEKLQSHNDTDKVDALKSIIIRAQEGEDMSFVFNDVIKIIDTRNIELKRFTNLFLVRHTKNTPIKQLMCVNTILKDLNDRSHVIKISALENLSYLGDEVIISNYINSIVKLVEFDCQIKLKLIDTIYGIFKVSESLFIDNGLHNILKDFLVEDELTLKSLHVLSLIEQDCKILKDSEITNLYKKFRKANDLEGLSSLLRIIYYRNNCCDPLDGNKNEESDVLRRERLIEEKELLHLLKKENYILFFYVSQLLISMNPSYKQVVYDTSLLYIDCDNEILYHMLILQESLLESISYDNSTYVLLFDDPIYIKKQKVKMLFYKLDDISIEQISKACNFKELLTTILEHALHKNFVIDNVFNHQIDEFIDILYRCYPFSTNYNHIVKSYLMTFDFKESLDKNMLTDDRIDVLKKYIFLCSQTCKEQPAFISHIECLQCPHISYDILKYYLCLFKRQVITQEELLEIFKRLKKNETLRNKSKIVMDIIEKSGPHVLFDFAENKDFFMIPKNVVSLDLYDKENRKKDKEKPINLMLKDILNFKPYCGCDTFDSDGGLNEDSKNCIFYEDKKRKVDDEYDKKILHEDELIKNNRYLYDTPLLKYDLNKNKSNESSAEKSNIQEDFSFENFKLRSETNKLENHLFYESSVVQDDWIQSGNEKNLVLVLNNEKNSYLVDAKGLKGMLFIDDKQIILNVDILDKPIKILYEINNKIHEVSIIKEEEIILAQISTKILNTTFKIIINDTALEVYLDIYKFIKPLKCTLNYFEDEFQKHKNYILVDKFDLGIVYIINESSFSFSVLEHNFFGKSFSNQIVLKGNTGILEML